MSLKRNSTDPKISVQKGNAFLKTIELMRMILKIGLNR